MLDEELLKILACPVCKADVILKNESLECVSCKRVYFINNGIPVMLAEEVKDEKTK